MAVLFFCVRDFPLPKPPLETTVFHISQNSLSETRPRTSGYKVPNPPAMLTLFKMFFLTMLQNLIFYFLKVKRNCEIFPPTVELHTFADDTASYSP